MVDEKTEEKDSAKFTKAELEAMKLTVEEFQKKYSPKSEPCSHCGYCPHCGRSAYPWKSQFPYYVDPWNERFPKWTLTSDGTAYEARYTMSVPTLSPFVALSTD